MKLGRLGLGVLCATLLLTSCGSNSSSVPPQVVVTLSPANVTMDQGATQQFTVTVSGNTNTAVEWSVREGSAGGAIDSQGKYTAPASAGTYRVVATSVADPNKSATADISVNSVGITVSPNAGDMEPGGTQQFTASVTGTVNHSVRWSVAEGLGGTITDAGMYTAPTIFGTYHVLAESAANSNCTARVVVTVAQLAVSIKPVSTEVSPGKTSLFNASVSGCMDDRVTWAVQEGNRGGSIAGDGLYTAPMESGTYHVVATSVAHPSVTGLAAAVVRLSGSFTSAGNMTTIRSAHTATLLPSGDVLLVGGGATGADGYWHATETAEIYDHVTGGFRPTGSMSTVRDGHTATLLPNGKVLIAGGGFGGWMAFKSAEIYDPATGQFTVTGSMMAARVYHTATLLANGKVLIAGGREGWMSEDPNPPDFAIAELYDPTTGAFTSTGRMSTTRIWHRTTLLSDNRVLVTGGHADFGISDSLDSAEVYDPAKGNFALVASFVGKRDTHIATLLSDHRVLLAGGRHTDPAVGDPESYDDAQGFDPATGQFSFLARMNVPRSDFTGTLLTNGRVLLAGGVASEGNAVGSAELFDPATGTFISTGSMARSRAGHTATLLLDGRVLVSGGASDRSAELYTPVH